MTTDTGPAFAMPSPVAKQQVLGENCSLNRVIGAKMASVLVVDESHIVVDVVRTILTNHGYQSVGTTDPDEAIRISTQKPFFDLLIVDFARDLRGRGLVEFVLLRSPSTKVLRMSTLAEPELRIGGRIRPESRFIAKPFSSSCLIEMVESIVLSDAA